MLRIWSQGLYKSDKYLAMHYKKGFNIGIRRKKAKKGEKQGKQIFSFGSGLHLSKARLMPWAWRTLKKLDEGNSEEKVRIWITGKMNDLR